MKRLILTGLTVLAIALTGTATATQPAYVVAAWNMPAYSNDHTYYWPQTLAFSTTSSTKNLDALDESLLCGHAYQVDVYLNDSTTASLLAGGFLNGPNNPAEHLAQGGQGVAYIAKETGPCATPSPSATPTASPEPSTSPTPTPTASPTPPTPSPSEQPSLTPSTPPGTETPSVTPTLPPTSTVAEEDTGRSASVLAISLFLGAISLAALLTWDRNRRSFWK